MRLAMGLIVPSLALSLVNCSAQATVPSDTPLALHQTRLVDGSGSLRPNATGTYNAVREFSIKSNPNGVWSYVYSGGLMTQKSNDAGGIKRLDNWSDGESFPTSSSVTGNKTGQTQSVPNGIGGSITFPTNYLELDGQNDSLGSDVRFTAPTAGSYIASGNFEGLNTDEQPHPVAVEVNGSTLFTATVSGYEVPVPFKLRLSLNQGDTVDFISQPYGNGEFLGTGLAAKVVAR